MHLLNGELTQLLTPIPRRSPASVPDPSGTSSDGILHRPGLHGQMATLSIPTAPEGTSVPDPL